VEHWLNGKADVISARWLGLWVIDSL